MKHRTHPSVEEWKRWGNSDPMYGVATVPGRETDGETPWTEDEFYQTGEKEVELFLRMWSSYGAPNQDNVLVEIGCGAGRLTRVFASKFKQVMATDVSEGMLDFARRYLPANVELKCGDGESLPFPDASADAGFSYIVFQHFDSLVMIESYVRELARVVRPGGTVMLHIPGRDASAVARQWIGGYWIRRKLTQWLSGAGFCSSPRSRFFVTMNYRMYPQSAIRQVLETAGFSRIETAMMPGSGPKSLFYFAECGRTGGAVQ
jgi:ubiquinone/menaquinone biosynthesis C-methylase UbiE